MQKSKFSLIFKCTILAQIDSAQIVTITYYCLEESQCNRIEKKRDKEGSFIVKSTEVANDKTQNHSVT